MPSDYTQAARRHYLDAERLADAGRHDNAGHLIGFAAECALKKAALGFFPKGQSEIEGHLPGGLKGIIKRQLDGRNAKGRLLALVQYNSSFFADWHVNDRYSPDGHVALQRYTTWRKQTLEALSIAGIRFGNG
jgi:hypothetical protein